MTRLHSLHFGCSNGSEDDLAHYLNCFILWSLIESNIFCSSPASQCRETIGLSSPTKQILHLIAVIPTHVRVIPPHMAVYSHNMAVNVHNMAVN